MEPWQQVVAAAVLILGTLGGGLKWFLTWLFNQIEKRDQVNAGNQAAFLAALAQKDQECDAQRDARLRDREQHTATLLELIEKFRSSLDRRSSSTKPDSQ